MDKPTTILGALMRFLILATNPKRFRWLNRVGADDRGRVAVAAGTQGHADATAVTATFVANW